MQYFLAFLMFDSILFSLAITDCLLIVDSCITKSIIPNWANTDGIEPYWFRVSFPAFWHPFKGIIVTITIYMVVAVSAERFRAVCHPLSKRHVSSYLYKLLMYIYKWLFDGPQYLTKNFILSFFSLHTNTFLLCFSHHSY